jgi:hypothetical protein
VRRAHTSFERRTAERIDVGVSGTQFIVDYQPVLQLIEPEYTQVTLSGLTGQHTIRIETSANAFAEANYPYDAYVPDSGLTLLLPGIGLVGLRAWRKRWQSSRLLRAENLRGLRP